MTKNKLLVVLVASLALMFIAAQCGAAAPETVTVVETVVVEKQVEKEVEKVVTVEVEKVVEVEKEAAPEKEVTITVLMSNAGDPYFQNKSFGYIQGGKLLEAQNTGLKVNVELYNAGGYEYSEVQIAQMEDAIQRGVDAIVLTAVNAEALVPVVEEALDAGIPVISDDSIVNTDRVPMKISENSYNVGKLEANAIARALNFEGNVVMLNGPAGPDISAQRAQGAKDEFALYPGITILAEQWHPSNLVEATRVMEDFIQAYGDDINGVYVFGTVTAIGAAEALKAAGYEPGDVVIGAIDLHDEALAYMNDGWLSCITPAQPIKLASLAVQYAYAASQGEQIPERVYTSDENCLTPDQITTFDTSDAMAPEGWKPPLR